MISQRAKLSVGLSSNKWENYKRTWQGALAALLLYLYKLHVVHATTISIRPLSPCLYLMSITHPHMFSIRPPCFLHVPWRHIFNLRCTCAHYEEPLSLDIIPNPNFISRLFPILLDPKFFQTTLDHSSFYHMTSRSHAYLLSLFCCRLIIIILNTNPSPSLSTYSSYNKREVIWCRNYYNQSNNIM